LAAFSPEVQLLCLCAGLGYETDRHDRIHALLSGSLDWETVIDTAALHGVTGMLYHHLARHVAPRVPSAALARLQGQAQGIQVYNMQVMTELMRIAAAFHAHDLPLLTYKGPVLAQRYYGSLALRRFGDVDLLVPREDLERATDLLRGQGYAPLRALSDDEEETWHDAQLGYELYHEEKRVMVELHWALLNRTMTAGLSPEAVWARAETHPLGDTAIQVLDPDDLLLYLCAHGTKHHWSRLLWVADVARVLRAHPHRDGEALLRRARATGSLRTLLLGVALAVRWLGARLPDPMQRELAVDGTVGRLVDEVEARWFGTDEGLRRPAAWPTFWFAYRTRQRLRDRGALLAHYARLAVTPTERDHAFAAVPASLSGLYYLLRPVRLLCDGGQYLARRLGGSTSTATRHAPDSV
jgi:hypothetical protein